MKIVGGSFQWIALTPNKGREGLEGVVAIPVFVVGTAAVISQRYQFGEILVTLGMRPHQESTLKSRRMVFSVVYVTEDNRIYNSVGDLLSR